MKPSQSVRFIIVRVIRYVLIFNAMIKQYMQKC